MQYDVYGRTDPSRIYIARPGKHIIGCLNGVDANSCSLNIDFVNADEITFDVYKYHDGELTAWYDYIDVMMELFVDHYGWFIIDDSPVVHNDGIKEYMSVTAKSYDYILHRYDLSTFDVNTASPTSSEMIATDNVYTYYVTPGVWYNLFRDRVLFYRDTSENDALLAQMNENTSYAYLQQLLVNYPHVIHNAWRIGIPVCDELRGGFTAMKSAATSEAERGYWDAQIEAYDNSRMTEQIAKTIMLNYPQLITEVKVAFDKDEYEYSMASGKYEKTGKELTAYEIMTMERQRMKELSLLDLVISDIPGWSIGYIDTATYAESNGVILANEVGSFEIDSQDVYTFLVSELAGYFNCIFDFDTVNNVINAYRIETIGDDTKIFLSFRNVQNSVDVTPAQELFTQFTVANSEGLSILYANFGDTDIEDISYFLNTKYLPQSTIDKYRAWYDFRESKRDEYIELSRSYNNQYNIAMEIKDRVPSDMLNISQLSGYTSQDQLEEEIDNYYALMIGMLDSFIYTSKDDIQPPSARELYPTFADYITAMNNYIEQLEELVDKNKEEEATAFKDSLYYNSYYMMKTFTVPNLIITYDNLMLPSYETKKKYYEAYEYDFREKDEGGFGWLYGVDELKAYQKTHADKVAVYQEYATAWEDIPDTPEGDEFRAKHIESTYREKHDLYVKYKNGYDSATAALAIRQREYDDAYAIAEDIDEERSALADSVKKENWNDFTNLDLIRLSRLVRHTDYVNDNIAYLENIDTSSTVIDKHIEMYNEALEELFAESHPQYTYATSVDDVLANNEYEPFHPEFKVGNFIRIGLDDETQVKLRLIGISFNPMVYDQNMELTYSNMVRYRKKRNDFVSLVESTIQSAKNQISARYNKSADADNTVTVTYDLVQKILQSSAFTGYAQNIQNSTINAAAGNIDSLSAEYIKTSELAAKVADIDTLYADSAFMNTLQTNLMMADTAFANYLQTVSQTVVTSTVSTEYVMNLVAGHISAGDLTAGDIVLTDSMRIISQNENGGNLLFNGSTLQFTDANGDVGIQIGYGNETYPHMVIKDENGAAMFTSSGITANGIPTGIIVNNMISDNTIEKEKLGFEIIEPNQYGGIDITQIYDGSGGVFGVEYTTFKNDTNQALSDLDEKIDNSATYTLYIDCPNGTNIYGQNVILNAKLFKNSVEVTNDFDDEYFTWTRQSNDHYGDVYWNDNHQSGTKTITVTANDVSINADFKCVFEYEGTTVISE